MKEKYLDNYLKKYLEDLSAKLPAPGGGSASALVAATGVSCLLMVVNFTINKKGYEQFQEEIKNICSHLSSLFSIISSYIDLDIEVYTKVSEAYKLPKDTETQKKERENCLQKVLKESCELSLNLMKKSFEALKFSERLLEIGNKNLITDIACGTVFLYSGIAGAKFNVLINLKDIIDKEYKETVLKEIKEIETETEILTKKVIKIIESNI